MKNIIIVSLVVFAVGVLALPPLLEARSEKTTDADVRESGARLEKIEKKLDRLIDTMLREKNWAARRNHIAAGADGKLDGTMRRERRDRRCENEGNLFRLGRGDCGFEERVRKIVGEALRDAGVLVLESPIMRLPPEMRNWPEGIMKKLRPEQRGQLEKIIEHLGRPHMQKMRMHCPPFSGRPHPDMKHRGPHRETGEAADKFERILRDFDERIRELEGRRKHRSR